MKILIIHNRYLERGGEDEVVSEQMEMLKRHQHEVYLYLKDNKEIEAYSPLEKTRFFAQESIWSEKVYAELKKVIHSFKPDVAHFHNTFYLISPSAYQACREEGVPVVQTIHNYRLLLNRTKTTHFPEFDIPVTDIKKFILRYVFLPRILNSFRSKRIMEETVGDFIVPSRFCKYIFAQNGFLERKIHVLPPHFMIERKERKEAGNYAIFIGRLAEYKGVKTLLKVFTQHKDIHLRIIGHGPLRNEVLKAIARHKNINYLGRMPYEQMLSQLRQAAVLVYPSTCYETFGRGIVEAQACAVPVIASNQGAMVELIEDGKTGFLFEPGNEHDLYDKLHCLFDDRSLAKSMGENARTHYERTYDNDAIYRQLMVIYEGAKGTLHV